MEIYQENNDVYEALKFLKDAFVTDLAVSKYLRMSIGHFNRLKTGKRPITEKTKLLILAMARELGYKNQK